MEQIGKLIACSGEKSVNERSWENDMNMFISQTFYFHSGSAAAFIPSGKVIPYMIQTSQPCKLCITSCANPLDQINVDTSPIPMWNSECPPLTESKSHMIIVTPTSTSPEQFNSSLTYSIIINCILPKKRMIELGVFKIPLLDGTGHYWIRQDEFSSVPCKLRILGTNEYV